MDDLPIIYILIGTGSKPLAGYSHFSGDFINACEQELKNVKPKQFILKINRDYKIFYLNKDNITYMTLTSKKISITCRCLSCREHGKRIWTPFTKKKFKKDRDMV